MQVVVQFSLPLPLGEGRGEGLVRQARNNSAGFSPLSRLATSQFFNAAACQEFLNELRAEARSDVVFAICAQPLTPTLSQRERESNCTTTPFKSPLKVSIPLLYCALTF